MSSPPSSASMPSFTASCVARRLRFEGLLAFSITHALRVQYACHRKTQHSAPQRQCDAQCISKQIGGNARTLSRAIVDGARFDRYHPPEYFVWPSQCITPHTYIGRLISLACFDDSTMTTSALKIGRHH